MVAGLIHHKLYRFPSSLRNGDKRTAALRRINKGKSEWKPCNSDRVFSKHFVDGEPTNANPDPTLQMGYDLVVWLLREPIRDNLPEVFIKSGHVKCHVIIDCAEVFIERPKSLTNQGKAATWSDYKHHNTLKFLVEITPSGFISFLSDCYGGRASDKFITADCGLYDILERDDEVMVDRGFQIREELMLRFCSLKAHNHLFWPMYKYHFL